MDVDTLARRVFIWAGFLLFEPCEGDEYSVRLNLRKIAEQEGDEPG